MGTIFHVFSVLNHGLCTVTIVCRQGKTQARPYDTILRLCGDYMMVRFHGCHLEDGVESLLHERGTLW